MFETNFPPGGGAGGGAGVEDVVHTWDGKESDKKEWREIMMRKRERIKKRK